MAEYNNSGSNSQQREKREVKKVSTQIAKSNKFSLFTAEDAAIIKQIIIKDIIIPSGKKVISDIAGTISDTLRNIVDVKLYGKEGAALNKSQRYGNNIQKFDYSAINGTKTNSSELRSTNGNDYQYTKVSINTLNDAKDLLSQMADMIDAYGNVRISDLNEMLGISGDYTDDNYGWTSVRDVKIIQVRDGYKLNLPSPRPIYPFDVK